MNRLLANGTEPVSLLHNNGKRGITTCVFLTDSPSRIHTKFLGVRVRRILIASVILLDGFLLDACGGSESTSPPEQVTSPPKQPTPTIDTKAIFSTTCSVCHGPDRAGIEGLAPSLTTESLAPLSNTEVQEILSQTVVPALQCYLRKIN